MEVGLHMRPHDVTRKLSSKEKKNVARDALIARDTVKCQIAKNFSSLELAPN
jgi:hypothetical protein